MRSVHHNYNNISVPFLAKPAYNAAVTLQRFFGDEQIYGRIQADSDDV